MKPVGTVIIPAEKRAREAPCQEGSGVSRSILKLGGFSKPYEKNRIQQHKKSSLLQRGLYR
jgi:hypothetical protein